MKKISKNTEDSAGIKQLLDKIVKEQRKIDQHEGNAVASHVRLGQHLTRLRALAKRTWGKQLQTIGISPRVASRYLKIAEHWPDENGLSESDLPLRLPLDLLKLEWLCRVPLDRLGDLLNKLDCKKATRPQVIAAVREALGEDPPVKGECDVEKFVDRCIHRLVNTVERLQETFPGPKQHDRARELLATGLQKVQHSLQSAHRDK